MTVTPSKQENDLTPLYRVQIERNKLVIWQIESESGHTYHVTMAGGRVSSCERADGEPCQGWKYRHSCHHATLAGMRELAHQDRREAEERALMDELSDAIAAERRHTAPLNGSREFRLMR